jgi:hypothetical protein
MIEDESKGQNCIITHIVLFMDGRGKFQIECEWHRPSHLINSLHIPVLNKHIIGASAISHVSRLFNVLCA